jgi:alpha-N-arabinofuranosidase
MTGIVEFAGIWKSRGQVYGAPGYYAFRMYSTAHPATPVQVVSDSGSYSVKNGVAPLPEIEDVPYLEVTAALDPSKKSLSIFCVNRSLNVRYPRRYRDSRLRSRFGRGGANAAKLEHQR